MDTIEAFVASTNKKLPEGVRIATLPDYGSGTDYIVVGRWSCDSVRVIEGNVSHAERKILHDIESLTLRLEDTVKKLRKREGACRGTAKGDSDV